MGHRLPVPIGVPGIRNMDSGVAVCVSSVSYSSWWHLNYNILVLYGFNENLDAENHCMCIFCKIYQ